MTGNWVRQISSWPLPSGAHQHRSRASLPVTIGGSFLHGAAPVKQGIHPDYHEINIIMTDGTAFKTRSCMGKPGETLRLDIDPKSHPAWTGVQRMVDTGGQVAKFNKKFASIGVRKG
jgi:large subunit ribosomal protein L31